MAVFFLQLGLVTGIGFAFNVVWEQLHATLYAHYRGGGITDMILLRAAGVDALILAGLWVAVRGLPGGRWAALGGLALTVAATLELWALATGRWAYNDTMPLVPGLNIGWSPFVQLAITGLAATAAVKYIFLDKRER